MNSYSLESIGVQGPWYRLADNWTSFLDVGLYANRPINYLEIGVLVGANLISVAKSYAQHPESKLVAVDPWSNYDDYNEYNLDGNQSKNYDCFLRNVDISGEANKIDIKRGYSHIEVSKLPDDFYDIIYIDGNHNAEYVLEDAVLCFRKLKRNGIMIFDDYGWGGPEIGIDAFLQAYRTRVKRLGHHNTQVFVKKL